jgi:hypothetical protein
MSALTIRNPHGTIRGHALAKEIPANGRARGRAATRTLAVVNLDESLARKVDP